MEKCMYGHIYNRKRYGDLCPFCSMERRQKETEGAKPAGFEPPLDILEKEVRPVCGWLICIEGARVGMDYKIYKGKNFVGRGDDMDIQILGDNKIARRNHAVIVFDAKKRENMILPGDSNGLVYLNGEAVYLPQPLSAYDVIEMWESTFLFVPFCGEHYMWEDDK